MKTKIMIITHKKFYEPKSNIFIPLHVGKKGKEDLGYIGDDTGENISEKNPNYCELTGQYWIWKNIKDVDYLGICHYRRFFIKPMFINDLKYYIGLYSRKLKGFIKRKDEWKERKINIKNNKNFLKYIYKTEDYIEKKINQYDVLLLKKFKLNVTLEELYSKISQRMR